MANTKRNEWRVAAAILACVLPLQLVEGQQASESTAPQTQRQAAAAVAATSRRMFELDTPEYSATFRHLLGAMLTSRNGKSMSSPAFQALATTRITTFDRDKTFRANVNSTVDLANRLNANNLLVLNSQPDIRLEFTDVILIRGPGVEICSGIIISKNRVLTARHCVCDGINSKVGIGSPNAASAVYKKVLNSRPTVAQCNAPGPKGPDLGILLTEDGVSPSGTFPPTATEAMLNVAKSGIVIGFGESVFGSSSGERRSASLAFASVSCMGSGPDADGQIAPDSVRFGCTPGIDMVAASSTGSDQCRGDSGGALLLVDSVGKRYFAGVVSGPTKESQNHGGCGDGGIYVRLDGQGAKWIDNNVG